MAGVRWTGCAVARLGGQVQWRAHSTVACAMRTHTCGGLRAADAGSRVRVAGWVQRPRVMGGLMFVPLRDRYGTIQLFVAANDDQRSSEESNSVRALLAGLPVESVVCAEGTVRARPPDTVNPNMLTGEVEVEIDKMTVLNVAARDLPFNTATGKVSNEEVRLRHRYLDLRRAKMQQNLLARSIAVASMRQYLTEASFLEIETPTLFKSTPEGAREFLVPTRTRAAGDTPRCYALAQSPQQYKQMLMAAGADRYFQLARCYRDEGGRSDRQPEFTQLDLEMSFASAADVMEVIEGCVRAAWQAGADPALEMSAEPFGRMNFYDAIRRFGIDKPDVRFGMELQALPEVGAEAVAVVLQSDRTWTKSDTTALRQKLGASFLNPAAELAVVKIKSKGRYGGDPLPGGHATVSQALARLDTQEGDAVFVAFAPPVDSDATSEQVAAPTASVGIESWGQTAARELLLGQVRLGLAEWLQCHGELQLSEKPHMLWVTDFPLFEREEEGEKEADNSSGNDGGDGSGGAATVTAQPWTPVHHPFTAPMPSDMEKLFGEDCAIAKITGQHYDLVCNGMEVGGGSVRIHDPVAQRHVFERILGLGTDATEQSFGHLLESLGSGCPPHAGFALGVDRLISLMVGRARAASIRDVIAFPKSLAGAEPLSGAPTVTSTSQLAELGLQPVESRRV